jgi:hypothetical protein
MCKKFRVKADTFNKQQRNYKVKRPPRDPLNFVIKFNLTAEAKLCLFRIVLKEKFIEVIFY